MSDLIEADFWPRKASESEMLQRIDLLERQVRSLRREVREWTDLVDVLATPPWKRLWYFLCGWRLWKVGRWY